MKRDYSKHLRRFHEAKWDEELIFDLSVPGQRGVNVTKPSPQVIEEVGDGADDIPPCMRRKTPPFLPEVHQARVNRHYLRLTQEILGNDITPDLGEGTCTIKYSPKVQEHIAIHIQTSYTYTRCRMRPPSRVFWRYTKKQKK